MSEALEFFLSPIIHQWVGLGMIVVSLVTFVACMKVTAPYGRYGSNASKIWGPKIPATLAWILMECPSPILVSFFFYYGQSKTIANYILFILFEFHYINRFKIL